jgi:hypothetical protein
LIEARENRITQARIGKERMRKPRDGIESIGVDGSIRLTPGAVVAFHVDTPFRPTFDELRIWMTGIRGQVLSASFGIENELILLALAEEFGSNDHGKAGSDYFNREQQLREEHSLKRKIARVKPVIRKRKSVQEAEAIIQRLAEYRELRNLLAHYPSWLEPVNMVPGPELKRWRTVGLKLYIADRHYVWEVDTEQAREWNDLILFVRVSIENIRREMLGAPLMNPDGSLSEPEGLPQKGARTAIIDHGNVSQMIVPKAQP